MFAVIGILYLIILQTIFTQPLINLVNGKLLSALETWVMSWTLMLKGKLHSYDFNFLLSILFSIIDSLK